MKTTNVNRVALPVPTGSAPTSAVKPIRCPDFEFHAEMLAGRLLRQLDSPPDAYSLEQLLKPKGQRPPGSLPPGFETESWCKTEDLKRASGLKDAAGGIVGFKKPRLDTYDLPEKFVEVFKDVTKRHALDLAHRLSAGGVATTLPSASFKRELRLRLLGALLELLENHGNMPTSLVRISHPDWEFSARRIDLDIEHAPRQKFQEDLRRSKVTDAGGFLVAHHDIELDRSGKRFRLYFYGIAAGPKIDMLQNLRKLPGYDRKSIVYYPFIDPHRPLRHAAAALSSFWPQQTWGHFGHQFKPANFARTSFHAQHQALYLLSLDHKTLSDVFVFDGVCACEGKLRLTV